MNEQKKYWHEIPQEEIEGLIKEKKTFGFVMENYKQPDWCNYPGALNGEMGCWSLVDNRPGGLRTKISKEYCKGCDCCLLPNELNAQVSDTTKMP